MLLPTGWKLKLCLLKEQRKLSIARRFLDTPELYKNAALSGLVFAFGSLKNNYLSCLRELG